MRDFPLYNSARVFLSCFPAWLVILVCLFYSGCLISQRDHSPWSYPNQLDGQYAILPVLPEQIRITLVDDFREVSMGEGNAKNNEETARIINKILDTIAAGDSNLLIGPDKINSILKSRSDLNYLEVYLQDPAPFNESWKREGLATISHALERPFVLRVNPTLIFKPKQSQAIKKEFDPTGRHWYGTIMIEIEMLDLVNAQVVNIGSGQSDFYGDVGIKIIVGHQIGPIPIPYALGKAFDDAADQAIRAALNKLFGISQKEGAVR